MDNYLTHRPGTVLGCIAALIVAMLGVVPPTGAQGPPVKPDPGGEIRVAKTSGIADGELVDITVEATGDEFSELRQCADTGTEPLDLSLCNVVLSVQRRQGTSPTNEVVTVQLRRMLRFFPSTGINPVDCAQPPGCVLSTQSIRLSDGTLLRAQSEPIRFDPASSVPNAVVKIAKRNRLTDSKIIDLRVKNTFDRETRVYQCPRDVPDTQSPRCQLLRQWARFDEFVSTERFSFKIQPTRMIRRGDDQTDCFARRACELRIMGDFGEEFPRIKINFDRKAPSQAPSLKVKKNRRLVDGQIVTVLVNHADPERHHLNQCVEGQGCIRPDIGEPKATKNGLRYQVPIARFVREIDCAASKTTCYLQLWNQRQGFPALPATVDLRFARQPTAT